MRDAKAEKLAAEKYPAMLNRAMACKLATGEALDVRAIGTPVEEEPRHFLLREFFDTDYCDATTETWIWSIGVFDCKPECGFHSSNLSEATGRRTNRHTGGCHGKIVASTATDLYRREGVVCVWLR